MKESEKVVGVSKTCEREFNSVIEETCERGEEEKKKILNNVGVTNLM